MLLSNYQHSLIEKRTLARMVQSGLLHCLHGSLFSPFSSALVLHPRHVTLKFLTMTTAVARVVVTVDVYITNGGKINILAMFCFGVFFMVGNVRVT